MWPLLTGVKPVPVLPSSEGCSSWQSFGVITIRTITGWLHAWLLQRVEVKPGMNLAMFALGNMSAWMSMMRMHVCCDS